MLKYNDPRWRQMRGGHKAPYDATSALRQLEEGDDDAWDELWENLHHQGDVGEASYAAIPHLVRIHRAVRPLDWNLYSLAAIVEIERHRESNPPLPDWLAPGYESAWAELGSCALVDLAEANDPSLIRAALGVIALAKGEFKLGVLISELDESEIDEVFGQYFASRPNDS
jgi:hypothetical protein